MPIVSTELITISQQANGVRVLEKHTDALGVVHEFPYTAPTLQFATDTMNARDLTSQLYDRDTADVLAYVAQGFNNTPASFDYTGRDMTALDGEDEAVVAFAREPGDIAFSWAWWIQNLNNPSWTAIRARLNYTVDQGDLIRARATEIINAHPGYNAIIGDPR